VAAFGEARTATPDDQLSQTSIERCEPPLADPPASWAGVWAMTSKSRGPSTISMPAGAVVFERLGGGVERQPTGGTMSDNVWPMLEGERVALAEYLETLAPSDWDHPSLCDGWHVKDVVTHVVAGAKSTPGRFIVGLVGSGFNFDKMIAKDMKAEADKTPTELVAELRAAAARKTRPANAMLGETLVHHEDIRRALGSGPGQYPSDDLQRVADYYKKAGPPIRAKGRIAGLQLEATDVTWSTGEGPAVKGPAISLLLAMSGRRAGLADLTGPGVAVLDTRL
jgi:uncharacterized protein (TIGR03083 family)